MKEVAQNGFQISPKVSGKRTGGGSGVRSSRLLYFLFFSGYFPIIMFIICLFTTMLGYFPVMFSPTSSSAAGYFCLSCFFAISERERRLTSISTVGNSCHRFLQLANWPSPNGLVEIIISRSHFKTRPFFTLIKIMV